MVKRLVEPFTFDSSFVLLISWTLASPPYTFYLNTIFEYPPEDQFLLAAGWAVFWSYSFDMCHLAAVDLCAHSQVVTDFSPITHGSFWPGSMSPFVPRWNIYRGQRGQALIPCAYWDILGPVPLPWPEPA